MDAKTDKIAAAIVRTLESPNVCDSNLENANLVDVVERLARTTARVAEAITAPAAPGHDATGGHVECLTEAVMGVTKGLEHIAEAIEGLSAAVAEH